MIFHWFKKNQPEPPPTMEYKKVSSKKEASEDLVRMGEDVANKSDYEQALKYFEKAIEMNPNNDFAWGDRGLMLDKLDRRDEAIESFSKALMIDPSNSITWHDKGLTLIKSNRLEESIECFDKAIELNGKYAKAWYNRGRALALLGNESEGQKSLDTAKKLDPMLYTKLKNMKS
jgi:tetratricopeptide (TPR) repeat protein